jgi:hypothetical protein
MSVITNDTIVVVRAGTRTNDRGETVPDWAAARRHFEDGVSVQPVTLSEPAGLVGRDATVTQYRVISDMGRDLDVEAGDRIEWQGDTWTVQGKIGRFYDQLMPGRVDHVEFAIQEVSG